MRWLDVAGPPGVGKSTLCDPIWGPHDIEPRDIAPPVEWHDFGNEVTRLLGLVSRHPTFTAAVRMNRRSMRKMACVNSIPSSTPRLAPGEREPGPATPWLYQTYIQTGFVQRGLGFGWRLVDMGKPVEELYHFFRLMPASLGVVFLETDPEALKDRNKAREKVKETAHENRAFMGPLMQPAIEFAKEVLNERGVPLRTIDTSGDIDTARAELVAFAHEQEQALGHCHVPALRPGYLEPRNAAQAGFGNQVKVLSTSPVWW